MCKCELKNISFTFIKTNLKIYTLYLMNSYPNLFLYHAAPSPCSYPKCTTRQMLGAVVGYRISGFYFTLLFISSFIFNSQNPTVKSNQSLTSIPISANLSQMFQPQKRFRQVILIHHSKIVSGFHSRLHYTNRRESVPNKTKPPLQDKNTTTRSVTSN